jgi:hypothetical protein
MFLNWRGNMDLSFYSPSDVEEGLYRVYRKNYIYNAEDLEIETVSDFLKIDVEYYATGPSFADYPEGHQPVIFLMPSVMRNSADTISSMN